MKTEKEMKYKLKYKPSKWDINNQLQKFYGVPIITEEVSSNNIYSNFKIRILRDEKLCELYEYCEEICEKCEVLDICKIKLNSKIHFNILNNIVSKIKELYSDYDIVIYSENNKIIIDWYCIPF